ncbi:MAG: efflux RND transporter periplasmic adaptor subunit [Balneolales bacterium]
MKIFSYTGLILSLFIFFSCQPAGQGEQQEQKLPSYPVVEVPLRTVTGYTTYPVSIEGTVNSAVRAKASGYITEVLVDEGEKVSKGQALFKLETSSLTQDSEAAAANVSAAQVEVDKLVPLVEKNIISNVQLETAKARLAQAKASFNSINASIGYATIKSSVDGYVGAISFREGALVSPNTQNPLTTVSDIDDIYAFFAMNERDYLNFIQTTEGETLSEKIENFPPIELQLVNGEMYKLRGEIETVTHQVNKSTGTVSFRAAFPNPNGILANGNSGNIRIPKIYENAVVVPEVSTFEQQGRVYVYRVEGDTLAVSSTIEVTDRVNNMIVVASGVGPGDKIVVEGVGGLSNNTPILSEYVDFESVTNSLNIVFK